jgi:hypothetical protein
MQKDLKIGLLAGLFLAAVILLLFSSRAGLNLMASLSRTQEPNADLYNWEDFNTEDAAFEYSQRELKGNYEKTVIYHIVKSGETLSQISYEYYGTAKDWRKILAANRQMIKDANSLTPGTKLIIPD